MKVDIDNKEVNLKYTFRAYMIFEQIVGHSFAGINLTEFITLFYSVLMASDTELTTDYDKFIDWLDENPNKLGEFTKWLTENIKKQNALTAPEKKTSKKKTEEEDLKKNK